MSLEGLSSLIQLESARLEGARQVTQSSQSVNQSAQQSGLQTASSKQNMWLQQIDAKMNKEMAEADVRRLESKLQRDRKAEKLAALVAQVVTVGSLASNMWNFGVNDLMKKDQKLGDIPDYLQAKPMNVSNPANLNLQWANKPGTADRTGYVTQPPSESSAPETVYQVSQAGAGSVSSARAATVSQADIKQIIGEDAFNSIKDKLPKEANGIVRFSSLSDSQKERVMQNLGHDVARGEAENVVEAFKLASGNSGVGAEVVGRNKTPPNPDLQAARELAQTLSITDNKPLDATKLAQISTFVSKLDPSAAQGITSMKTPQEVLARIESVANPKPPANLPEKAEKALIDDVRSINNAVLNREATVRTMVKPEYAKARPEYAKGSTTPVERVQVEFKGKTIQFDLDADWMKDKGFGQYAGMSFSEIYKNSPQIAYDIIDKKSANVDQDKKTTADILNIGVGTKDNPKFSSKDVEAPSKAVPTVSALIDNLKGSGKLDKTYNTSALNQALSGASTVGKGLMNVMVQTAQESVPYFQAYMKAKENADNTEEQLNAARAKLEAANRKLKSIEQQINDFALRGA